MLTYQSSTIALSAIVYLLSTSVSLSEGAVALGLAGDVSRYGYSIGIVVGRDREADARREALDWCRTRSAGTKETRSNCEIVITFRDQCVAEANDPEPGTPGFGWAVGPTRQAAERSAMVNCEATAGSSRQRFCKRAGRVLCDGAADR